MIEQEAKTKMCPMKYGEDCVGSRCMAWMKTPDRCECSKCGNKWGVKIDILCCGEELVLIEPSGYCGMASE